MSKKPKKEEQRREPFEGYRDAVGHPRADQPPKEPKATHAVLWVKSNGEVINEPDRAQPTLEEYRAFVDGDIELVRIDGYQYAIVNEDGRRLALPFNEKASEIAGAQLLGNVAFVRPNTSTN